MVNERENWRPLGGSSRRYENIVTGEQISRRAFLDIRVRTEGFRSFEEYRKTADTQTAQARALGFRDMGQVRQMQRADMYEVYERIRMTKRGGVPIERLQDLTSPEGAEFNAALADMIRAGEFPLGKPRHSRASYGRRPRMGDATRRLFELLEIAPQDWQRFYDNLWWSP